MVGLTHTVVATGANDDSDQLSVNAWNAEHDMACFAEVALTDAATITPDLSAGFNFAVTLGGNRTLANPTNGDSGQSGGIIVTQDATGSRTLTYGSNWKFEGGASLGGVLSTTANAVDLISYYVRANGTIIATLIKDFKA